MNETRSTCPYCGVGCGVVIESEGDLITGVRGDPRHPANLGRLCTKGSTLHLTVTAPVTRHARLLAPMRREHRGGQPRAVTWDQALGFASEFFERMVSAGWCEIARQFHAEEVQTYFKAGKGPYQLDHVFAGALLGEAAVRFDVVRSEPVLAVSDHAALLVEFDLTKLATAGSPFLTKT